MGKMFNKFTVAASLGGWLFKGLPAGLLISVVSLVAVAQDSEPLPTTAEEATALEVSRELEQRRLNIQNMVSDLGIYDASLIEAYSDLGSFYYEIGQYQDAVELFRQALQVARISAGLNSERQLPVIDQVITGSVAMRDWEATDDMHHLRFYLKNRLYDPADIRFAEAIDELGQWKLRVMRENLMDQGYRGLTSEASGLSDLYRDAIGKIQSHPDYAEKSLLPLYQGKSFADIEIARYIAQTPYQYFEGTVSQFIYQNVCNNIRDAQGNVVRSCYSVRRENPRYRQSQQDSKRSAVNRSVRNLESSIASLNGILERNTDIPPQQREETETQIRELQVEFDKLIRSTRRISFF